MSLSYKFILDKRRKQIDGIYPIKLRVYDVAGNKEKSLDINVHENDWNEQEQVILSSDPNYKTSSFRLSNTKVKIDRRLLLAEDEEYALTADGLIASLEKKQIKLSDTSFPDYTKTLTTALYKAGKAGTALAYSYSTL